MKLVIWSLKENHIANITYDSYNIQYFILLACLRKAENPFSNSNNIFKCHKNKTIANKQWITTQSHRDGTKTENMEWGMGEWGMRNVAWRMGNLERNWTSRLLFLASIKRMSQEWRMKNEKWEIGNVEWEIESGKQAMSNRDCGMRNEKLKWEAFWCSAFFWSDWNLHFFVVSFFRMWASVTIGQFSMEGKSERIWYFCFVTVVPAM